MTISEFLGLFVPREYRDEAGMELAVMLHNAYEHGHANGASETLEATEDASYEEGYQDGLEEAKFESL
jgi:flagellar biosynthesis/type III secretory pathway protein FliH